MKSYIILGDSGFIGSGFVNLARKQNRSVIGINRQRIVVIENAIVREFSRHSSKLSVEILPFLGEGAVVINTAWIKNDRADRDSALHNSYAIAEMQIIDALKNSGCQYMSFGSIAEIADESISPSSKTAYSGAKKILVDYLSKSELKSIWLRVASLYGQSDKRDWLIPRLIHSLKGGEEVILENPLQQINLCHIDSLVKAAFALIRSDKQGTFNVTTEQWVTIGELKKSFNSLTEPNYLVRNTGPFSNSDPDALHIYTPPISDFFTELRYSHKS